MNKANRFWIYRKPDFAKLEIIIGMFLFKAGVFLEELHLLFMNASKHIDIPEDYAVMEKLYHQIYGNERCLFQKCSELHLTGIK